MNTLHGPITTAERAVWLALCAGRTIRQAALAMSVSPRRVEKLRVSLAQKLDIDPGDFAAFVRTAAAVGILRELPPLNVIPVPPEPPNGVRGSKFMPALPA